MKDLIKDLDAALTATGRATGLKETLAEEHPNASEQSIENAIQLQALAKQLQAVTERIGQRKDARRRRRKAAADDLQGALEDVRTRIALLAAEAGIATDEEKHLIKEARDAAEQRTGNGTELGKVFDPSKKSDAN